MTTTHVPLQEWGNNMEWDLRDRPTSRTWRSYWIALDRHNAQPHQDRTTAHQTKKTGYFYSTSNDQQREETHVSDISSDEGSTATQNQKRTTCFYYMLSFVEEECSEEGAADIANRTIRQGIEEYPQRKHFELFVWKVIESPDYAN